MCVTYFSGGKRNEELILPINSSLSVTLHQDQVLFLHLSLALFIYCSFIFSSDFKNLNSCAFSHLRELLCDWDKKIIAQDFIVLHSVKCLCEGCKM